MDDQDRQMAKVGEEESGGGEERVPDTFEQSGGTMTMQYQEEASGAIYNIYICIRYLPAALIYTYMYMYIYIYSVCVFLSLSLASARPCSHR